MSNSCLTRSDRLPEDPERKAELDRARDRSRLPLPPPFHATTETVTELASARADFHTACQELDLAQLQIECATNAETVRRLVDKARQQLQIIVCNAEVIFSDG